ALSPTAAETLTAYTVYSGKTKKIHKTPTALYNKLVPLIQANYNASADSVILVPRGKHKLPKLEQLHVNVSVLTDPMGRPINNGKNFTATTTNSGFVLSTTGNSAASATRAAAIDALFERGMIPSVRSLGARLTEPGADILD